MSDNSDVWVIVPVYNEETVVTEVLAELLPVFRNVVCVDDGSRDRSALKVAATQAHLIRHPVNLGQGAALQTGLSYALARPGARYFVTFDSDGQHRVADAENMVALAREHRPDAVLGSRFLRPATTVPPLKRAVLRVATALSNRCRKLKLTDAHNGLRVLSRGLAQQLRIRMNGMAHASEIIANLSQGGYRVIEAPVTVRYTEYSRSKGQSLVNGVNILFDLTLRNRSA
ncbi:MAG: glycosyltransferase family 2 protein [Micromonosporaceae bacterium]